MPSAPNSLARSPPPPRAAADRPHRRTHHDQRAEVTQSHRGHAARQARERAHGTRQPRAAGRAGSPARRRRMEPSRRDHRLAHALTETTVGGKKAALEGPPFCLGADLESGWEEESAPQWRVRSEAVCANEPAPVNHASYKRSETSTKRFDCAFGRDGNELLFTGTARIMTRRRSPSSSARPQGRAHPERAQ